MQMQTQTQFLTRRRAVADQVVERLASDAVFRQAMIADPKGALDGAGFAAEMAEGDAWESDVARAVPCPYSCWSTRCTSLWSLG